MPTSTPQQPPTPSYIFRGHTAAIHALHFFQSNHYFASGDSDGWVVIWRLTTRRPAAAWKAHDAGVMGIKDWQGTRLITHGRDHKLRVWQVREEDFEDLGTTLPVDGSGSPGDKQPWLVHSMDINALNYCAFALCADEVHRPTPEGEGEGEGEQFRPLLLAAPNGLDSGGIDIFQLPSERRVSKLASDKSMNSGMAMTVRLFHHQQLDRLMLIVGYEDGQVAVFARKTQNVMPVWIWEKLVVSRPHQQPMLSLDVARGQDYFVTSSADAVVAKFAVPVQQGTGQQQQIEAAQVNQTKHAGQQDLKIRSDGRILATAGWDKTVRVYSVKTLKEVAVLQWHREGCYALAFADVDPPTPARQSEGGVMVAMNAMERLNQARDAKVHNTHWLVAGSKDGKISLWDIY